MAVENIIRGLLNKGKAVRDIQEPWWSRRYGDVLGTIAELPDVYAKAKMYAGNKLDDTYTALTNLLKVADTEEGMKLYEKKLSEFTTASTKLGGFADNIVQSETLKMLGGQKKQMHNDFTTAIKATNEELIHADDYLDKAEEFINIQDTMDAKGIKGSVSDFLRSELSNANSLYDNMVTGFQIQGDQVVGTNFKYNGAKTNDKDTFRELKLYRDRLELATKSLAGDGTISSQEAEAIIIGDDKHYFTTKNAALRKAEKNYTARNRDASAYDRLINTATQKAITNVDDWSFMKGDMDSTSFGEVSNKAVMGDWAGVIEDLKLQRAEKIRLRNEANENYKNWYGEYFEDISGGMTQEEIEKFNLEFEQKKKEGEEKAEQKKLEKTKERYKEPKEGEKVQTYSIDEKIDADNLLTSYVSGNVADSVLKDVGGQSLLNRVRVMKNAYKGQKPKGTIIPGVETKGITPINIKTLKETDFKNPGKSGTFSWEDITSQIYSSGKAKTEKGASIVEQYLSDKVKVDDLKIRWRGKRESVKALKNKFKKLGISLEEFKKQYSKDYQRLVNLLSKSRTK